MTAPYYRNQLFDLFHVLDLDFYNAMILLMTITRSRINDIYDIVIYKVKRGNRNNTGNREYV